MDELSYEALSRRSNDIFREVAETMTALRSEGFLELVDYQKVLNDNQDLLHQMLAYDLSIFDSWLNPLEASIKIWLEFADKVYDLERQEQETPSTNSAQEPQYSAGSKNIYPALLHLANNRVGLVLIWIERLSKRARDEDEYLRSRLIEILRSYLMYVNANIVLSNELGVGFHDWADFQPFYQRKFLTVGRKAPDSAEQASVAHKLFEVSFPEFAISDTRKFMKVVQDRRVEDLRELVQASIDGKVNFDQEFARSVFKEVLKMERQITRYRNIISYLTLPLDFFSFLPGVGAIVQKGIEEVVGGTIEHKMKEKYRWFYLLSDVSDEAK